MTFELKEIDLQTALEEATPESLAVGMIVSISFNMFNGLSPAEIFGGPIGMVIRHLKRDPKTPWHLGEKPPTPTPWFVQYDEQQRKYLLARNRMRGPTEHDPDRFLTRAEADGAATARNDLPKIRELVKCNAFRVITVISDMLDADVPPDIVLDKDGLVVLAIDHLVECFKRTWK
jgi:hypothetical protein